MNTEQPLLRLPDTVVRLATAVLLLCAVAFGSIVGCKRATNEPDLEPAVEPRPNIILILVDTLRADRLGCYGCPRNNSPTLDSIAAEGVLFARTVSAAPWTQPSIASLFASVYPGVHKVLSFRQAMVGRENKEERVAVFDESFVTLAEELHDLGYTTAAFVANLFILEPYGFAQGFDRYETFDERRPPGDVINREVARWLRERDEDRPLFLYLHYMDVHGPYGAGPEFHESLLDEVEALPTRTRLTTDELKRLGYLFSVPERYNDEDRHNRLSVYREYWVARYDAGIREFDGFLRDLRDDLTELGVWHDAYVIITSDHGEALCEHGLWEHGFSTHDTDLHVPLILRWPGELAAGAHVIDTVRLIDLMPTLLEQLGASPPQRAQGVSLVDLLAGRDRVDPIPAFAEAVKSGDEQKAIYLGEWKLMLTPATSKRGLYRISDDSGEQIELSAKHPDAAETLERMIEDRIVENEALSGDVTPSSRRLTSEQIERLKALGYLGD